MVPPCYLKRQALCFAGLTCFLYVFLGLLYMLPQTYVFDQVPVLPANTTCTYDPVNPSIPKTVFYGSFLFIFLLILQPCCATPWPLNLRRSACQAALGWIISLVMQTTLVTLVVYVKRKPFDKRSSETRLACEDERVKEWSPSVKTEWLVLYYSVLFGIMVSICWAYSRFRASRRQKVQGAWKASGFGVDPWASCQKEAYIV